MNSRSCWTCRIRRKKCDGVQPVCDACSALSITCHNRQSKPEWMDGGAKQDEMAAQIRREVRESGPRRRQRRSTNMSTQHARMFGEDLRTDSIAQFGSPNAAEIMGPGILLPQPEVPPIEVSTLLGTSSARNHRSFDGNPFPKDECIMSPVGWSNNVLLMFYLDSVMPFLFPLYRPSLHRDGGRAWILEMVFKSPAIRQAVLCQASLFSSLSHGSKSPHAVWETIMKHTGDAFAMLRKALQFRIESPIPEPPHCTVRLIAAVVQLQRFEVATLSFQNCQQHLNAALDLFRRLLDSQTSVDHANPRARFNAILRRLRTTEWGLTDQPMHISSAEQSAFRFSSALLIVDDIVASTILKETPKLYEYHKSILGDPDRVDDYINLATVIGCQNWVFIELGRTAALDSWKQQCVRAGNLDVMELARRGMSIRDTLQGHLERLKSDPMAIPETTRAMKNVFTADYLEHSIREVAQTSVSTRVWAHAAMIYLHIVVSGWQPTNPDVRHHVDRVIELLSRQLSPPVLLRTLAWPFCVAGCLVEPGQESRIRAMVDVLHPSGMFATIYKALDIMEQVWATRNSGGIANRDIASCLRSQGDLILLV